jgi:hypothetical protein
MKHCLLSVLLAMIWGLIPAQNINPLSHLESSPYGYEMRNAEKFLKGGSKGVGTNYDLKYHRFNWYINPDTCYISGGVTSYFVTKTAAFSSVSFELSSVLTVDSVRYAGNNVVFNHASDQLDISLGTSLPLGRLDSLTVFYHGNPNAGAGFGSFIRDTHNTVPVIWTLSEPYGARDWWPCKNILSDKIDSIDVFVTTPSVNRVASNGVLVSETVNGGDKTFHWKHRYPIAAYLIAIAVTNYTAYTDLVPLGNDTLQMLNYVYPEDLAAWQAGTPYQIGVMQLYSNLFGPYPFLREKYGHCQFNWGGGMEHQTMSFVINEGFDLLAHEMAHQWFGDKVTCNSWHDIWVNEGFATYCQGMTLETAWGGQYWPVWLRQRIDDVTSQPGGSVYCYDTTTVNNVFDWRLSYQKGAMVLHMLRWVVGDSAFFQTLKNYIANPAYAYSYAGTEDVKNEFENVSGLNLDDYFNDWIYHEGYPIYSFACTIEPDTSVDVTISQTQSHPSVSYFELPVPLRFKNATHDTIIVFDNQSNAQNYTVHPGFMPDSILFDPEMKLLARLDTMIIQLGVPEYQVARTEISPNPASDFINISSYGGLQGDIEIYSIDGRYKKVVPALNTSTLKLDVSDLSQGVYIIKLTTSYNILYGRFVKL